MFFWALPPGIQGTILFGDSWIESPTGHLLQCRFPPHVQHMAPVVQVEKPQVEPSGHRWLLPHLSGLRISFHLVELLIPEIEVEQLLRPLDFVLLLVGEGNLLPCPAQSLVLS